MRIHSKSRKKKTKQMGYWVPPEHAYPPELTRWITRLERNAKKKKKEPRELRHYPR